MFRPHVSRRVFDPYVPGPVSIQISRGVQRPRRLDDKFVRQSTRGSSSEHEDADTSEAGLKQFSERLEQVWSIRRVRTREASTLQAAGSCLTSMVELPITLFTLFLAIQQPVPVACEDCGTQGTQECKWCAGTGYFVIGDQMLCQVPSRNTQCLICHGQVSILLNTAAVNISWVLTCHLCTPSACCSQHCREVYGAHLAWELDLGQGG